MKTLILGIGNPILGDDGIGVHVARELARRINDKNIDVRDVSVDGLNLFDFILGYDRLVIIDAIVKEGGGAGEVYKLRLEDIGKQSYSAVPSHHGNLASTLAFGEKLFPSKMPKEVVVFAVNTKDVASVTEELTAEVGQAIPKVVELIMAELKPLPI